jgi:hypothetical protein
MRRLGYWKSSLRDRYALPQHFEAPMDAALRAKLVVYLDGGVRVNQYRGISPCRYGCGDNGSAERTDGDWLWPEGLSHYIERHGVALPQEFVDHVLRGRPSPPPPPDTGSLIDCDESDWLRWSDEAMPDAFRAALQNAIAAAEHCVGMRLESIAAATEAELGIGSEECMGCDRRACLGRALCGRCLIDQEAVRFHCDMEQLAALVGG